VEWVWCGEEQKAKNPPKLEVVVGEETKSKKQDKRNFKLLVLIVYYNVITESLSKFCAFKFYHRLVLCCMLLYLVYDCMLRDSELRHKGN
jgi:hypothetical protein